MNDNNEVTLQLSARLNAHEFVLEVMLANWLATMAADNARQFGADFVRVAKRGYGPISGDTAEIQRIQRARELGEQAILRLFEKAARRAQEIRERTAQARQTQRPPEGD